MSFPQWYDFVRSAILFCWGVYRIHVCFSILWYFQKLLNAFETNSPPISGQNILISYSNCVSTSTLDFLNFSKQSPLNFNTYNHIFFKKSWMKVTKYLVPPMDVVLMELHMRFGRLPPPFVWKRSLMLFIFYANFTRQRWCKARKSAKAHTTHHVLEGINTLHVHMTKMVVSKLERAIFRWKLHQVGHFRFVQLKKIDSYKLRSYGAIVMASPWQDLTNHSFRLNWTSKPFNASLFTKSKLAYNLNTWSTSLIQIWLILSSKIVSTIMNLIPIA